MPLAETPRTIQQLTTTGLKLVTPPQTQEDLRESLKEFACGKVAIG